MRESTVSELSSQGRYRQSTAEPQRSDFADERAFAEAWKRWRQLRDRNNKAVRDHAKHRQLHILLICESIQVRKLRNKPRVGMLLQKLEDLRAKNMQMMREVAILDEEIRALSAPAGDAAPRLIEDFDPIQEIFRKF